MILSLFLACKFSKNLFNAEEIKQVLLLHTFTYTLGTYNCRRNAIIYKIHFK